MERVEEREITYHSFRVITKLAQLFSDNTEINTHK